MVTPENQGCVDMGMTKRQAGRLGGLATRSRHGSGYYARIGRMGASKGGKATLANHGVAHFRRIGEMGGRAKARNRSRAGR